VEEEERKRKEKVAYFYLRKVETKFERICDGDDEEEQGQSCLRLRRPKENKKIEIRKFLKKHE
jgi:hypothetical protein